MKSTALAWVLLGWIVSTGALMAAPLSAEQKARNDGLFLLKTLCTKEAKVEYLMLLKTAPPEIGVYTKKLSAQGRTSLDLIAAIQKESPSALVDTDPLPPFETETRDSIQAEKQHQLLFGTSGPAFARALVIAQIEACVYAKHLTLILSQKVKRESQKEALLKNSAQWAKLADQGFELLGSKVVR